MRLWHVDLLPYLPDLQFKGQLREIIVIMRDWRDKGETNHLLINKVMEYPKYRLYDYFCAYADEYEKRYNKSLMSSKYGLEFWDFLDDNVAEIPKFGHWHNKEYLRVCMANLYEKHYFGVGKSRITDEEWGRLLEGYKILTGEDYVI